MLLRCGVVQFQHEPGNRAANLATLERFVRRGCERGVKLLAFPEMCVTGYWHARKLDRAGWTALSEPVPGPTTFKLLEWARETDVVDLPRLVGRLDFVNIKLDKCGGLTEALEMINEARKLGLRTMVGNMLGTSLAMAPAALVGQMCTFVDLDGPIFLKSDRRESIRYQDGLVICPDSLWGSPE